MQIFLTSSCYSSSLSFPIRARNNHAMMPPPFFFLRSSRYLSCSSLSLKFSRTRASYPSSVEQAFRALVISCSFSSLLSFVSCNSSHNSFHRSIHLVSEPSFVPARYNWHGTRARRCVRMQPGPQLLRRIPSASPPVASKRHLGFAVLRVLQ